LSRRLGDAIVDRLAGPLLGGIFAGDARQISVRAAFPQLVAAEKKYGSLVRAMQAARKERGQRSDEETRRGEQSAFLSLKGGMSDLVTATAHLLKVADVRKNEAVKRIARLSEDDTRGRWAVESVQSTYIADDVVLAIPPVRAKALLVDVDPAFTAHYDALVAHSTATVFLGFRTRAIQHPLDATGFIVPENEKRPILASTWVTSKWEHRAPAGHALIRVFIGGARGEHELERDDYALVGLARRQLSEIMGITALPVFSRVFRFDHASPQMHVGHLERIAKLRDELANHPGLHVAANGYKGTGIPDCIKQGTEVAEEIAAES
jgi:oxygen-dependent protoporphyrinogen oxidase